jgi:DNA-directed RNA polymerase subunit F
MIGKEIIDKKPVSLVKIKEILKERNKEGELTYEQKTTYDYVKKFAKLTAAKQKKLLADLQSIEGIEEAFALKISDVLPDNLEVLKLMAHKNSKASEDDLKKAFDVVKKYI